MDPASVLAHQGGWDEVAFVAAPLIVFAGLLWMAKRRAEKITASAPGETDADPS